MIYKALKHRVTGEWGKLIDRGGEFQIITEIAPTKIPILFGDVTEEGNGLLVWAKGVLDYELVTIELRVVKSHKDGLINSLRILDNFFESTPKEEIDALIDKAREKAPFGPTVSQYFESLREVGEVDEGKLAADLYHLLGREHENRGPDWHVLWKSEAKKIIELLKEQNLI